MTADRNEAAVRPAGKSARETYVYERFDCVHTVCVLRESHRPDEDRVRTVDEEPGTCLDPLSWSAALLLDLRPLDRLGLRARSVESDRVFAYEAFVDPASLAVNGSMVELSARNTPTRNARSPPVSTVNQWSAIAVPPSALSGTDGTQ